MADDDFEVLVSTSDYLKLETQCRELREENEKLAKERRELGDKLFEMKEENGKLNKRVTTLSDHNKYLSLKGIEQTQAFLRADEENMGLKESVVQT